jgi:hypothetical protein
LDPLGPTDPAERATRRELTDAWLRTLRPPTTGRLEVWDSRVGGLVPVSRHRAQRHGVAARGLQMGSERVQSSERGLRWGLRTSGNVRLPRSPTSKAAAIWSRQVELHVRPETRAKEVASAVVVEIG